jgi:hypothetical protein
MPSRGIIEMAMLVIGLHSSLSSAFQGAGGLRCSEGRGQAPAQATSRRVVLGPHPSTQLFVNIDRRSVLLTAATAAFPGTALAVSDKTVSKFATQAPPTDKDSEPFTYLDSGVGYREYKAGKGDAEVEEGSRVTVNLVGRLLNLNGVKFFSTKEKTDEFGEGTPLTFTIGAGEALPGLEQGMIGMKKGAVRKVCFAALWPVALATQL